MRRNFIALLLALAFIVTACGGANQREARVGDPAAAPAPPAGATPVLTGSMKAIDGATVDLSDFKGKVVLIVNTASSCGYTSQFEGLQTIYESYAKDGLVVLGFPSNDFQQEFADDGKIKSFCSTTYGVTFPMFSRTQVLGPDANPVFAALAAEPAEIGAPPQWNFTKYLLDRNGVPVARWKSNVEPNTPEVTNTIEALLAQSETATAGA